MILIVGATGKTGSEATKQLKAAGVPFRVLVRNEEKAKAFDDAVIGDLADKDSVMRALDGIERTLLIVPNNENQLELEKAFTDSCVESGVKHLVKLASLESVPTTVNPITKMHVDSEAYIKETSLDWTILKPTFFYQNFSNMAVSIRETDSFSLPMGDGTVSANDIRDVGAVMVKVLTEEGHAGQVYWMTGPELMTFYRIAEIFSEVLGRKITYNNVDPAAYKERLLSLGLSEWRCSAVCDEFKGISDGLVDHTTETIKELLGRDPIHLSQFVEDHRDLFTDK